MKTKQWIVKLAGAFIQGIGHGGSAYVGLALVHTVDATVPVLNLESVGIVVLTSGLLKFFQFLDTNPLPVDEETTVIHTEVTQTTTKTLPDITTQTINIPKP